MISSMKLWNQQLAYFTFEVTEKSRSQLSSISVQADFDEQLKNGSIRLIPQQYEDFFGPAATNIFNSNIGLEEVSNVGVAKPNSQKSYEAALGRTVVNMYDYYDDIQAKSIIKVCEELEALASA